MSICTTVDIDTVPRWDKKGKIPKETMTDEQLVDAENEVNEYKQNEMKVHPSSVKFEDTMYNGKPEQRKVMRQRKVRRLNEALRYRPYCYNHQTSAQNAWHFT